MSQGSVTSVLPSFDARFLPAPPPASKQASYSSPSTIYLTLRAAPPRLPAHATIYNTVALTGPRITSQYHIYPAYRLTSDPLVATSLPSADTMAEHSVLKLDPDSHLLLEQPLLRLPQELLRKNLKAAQRSIELVNKNTTTAIQTSKSQTPAETLASLDATLQKAQNLKRKLEALHAEEQVLHSQQKARIEHLQTLHEIPSLGDVAYDRWSHVRLDRLLVDYLLRQGFTQSAKELAEENKLGGLVDVGVFEGAGRIEQALRRGEVKEALSWCAENKNALKKTNVSLTCGLIIGEGC